MHSIRVIVPLHNRGNDVTKLLMNLERLSVRVVVVDHHSLDIDFPSLLPTLDLKVDVIQTDGPFNLAKALQIGCASIQDPNAIVVLIDADTVFDDAHETFKWIWQTLQDPSCYLCPNVSTEARPGPVLTQAHRGYAAEFNGRVWVPTTDPRGAGFIACRLKHFRKSGGYLNSDLLDARGEYWGSADTHLMERLDSIGLKRIRPTLADVWLRKNDRDVQNKWYSKGGGSEWWEK